MELRHNIHGKQIQSVRLADARALLNHYNLKLHKGGFSTMDPNDHNNLDRYAVDMLHKIGWSIKAIEQGVKRAHIISPKHGAVLQELYTRDGSGTLVSGDLYEGIRRATVHDVSAIHDLITPLIKMGTLIDRPKATLEKDIDTYYVFTRDNHIVACGQLKQFDNGFAEIGCLVVNVEYRSAGRGDTMLGYLERMCLLHECTSIFVLSTQTMEWFVERGFEEVGVERLPPSRQATYNHARKSKIYIKTIESMRDLDASELWWNR
jgi:amino-acid N-acetyltransferase